MPFIRRLVVTGFDKDGILHGFFGDEWRKGVGPVQECERRNYLFAAKSVGWAKVKYQYDISPHETVPFMKPLQNVPPQPGTRWRANFYRIDHDDGKRSQWVWAPVRTNFHEFQSFGELLFGAR